MRCSADVPSTAGCEMQVAIAPCVAYPVDGLAIARGCSSMVEQQPSKLMTRVRFPSPAPIISMAYQDAGD